MYIEVTPVVQCRSRCAKLLISLILICGYFQQIDAQSCVDTVNFRQRGISVSDRFTDSQVIVPRSNFSCDGRITGYQIRVEEGRSRNYPIVQVWRPASSTTFTWVDNVCPLSDDDITLMEDDINDEYYIGNVSCTGNNTIGFQSGDVIGYYNGRRRLFYRLQSIQTIGYTSYIIEDVEDNRDFEDNDLLTSFNINDPGVDIVSDTQPLIQVMFDIRCNDLSAPANGEILSCSSGTVGVGYEGDTCNFTCNTGYELTDSVTRTCQSDGSWSGSEVTCSRVVSTTSTSASVMSTTMVPAIRSIALPSVAMSNDVQVSNDSGSRLDSGGVIGGVVGGVILLLMIAVVLCVVILCTRRSRKRKVFSVDDNVHYDIANLKQNAADTKNHNASCDVTAPDLVHYSTIKPKARNSEISITSNPSYYVPLTTNPSYNVPTKPYNEDEYSYVQPDELNQHSDLDGSVEICDNPSYGVSIGEDRATVLNAASDATAHQLSPNDATEDYDYAYAHNDQNLHHRASVADNGNVTNSTYLTIVSNESSS